MLWIFGFMYTNLTPTQFVYIVKGYLQNLNNNYNSDSYVAL
jgi:hypothetical protein